MTEYVAIEPKVCVCVCVCLCVCLSFMDDQTVGPIDHKLGMGIDGHLGVEIG